MERLHDAKLQKHLDGCPMCTKQVAEHRAWIATLRFGLSMYFNPIDVLALNRNGHGQP